MRYAILDTNVYIDHWEGRQAPRLDTVRQAFVIRHSAVVLSELTRGARTLATRRLVDAMRRAAPEVWAPSAADWWRAGELIRSIGNEQGWQTSKRREFQNDALIALTAVRYGATVVTRNSGDFTLLREHTPLKVLALE